MFKFQRKKLIRFIVLIENILIQPIEKENDDKKQDDEVGIVEEKIAVKTPGVEGDHQFIGQRERSRRHKLMQSPLIVVISLLLILKQFFNTFFIGSVPQINPIHNDVRS